MQLTAPARTIRDLAQTAPDELEKAINEAHVLRLVTHRELRNLLTLPQCGVRAVRQAIGERPTMTRSEAERRLRALIAKAGLPAPQSNVKVSATAAKTSISSSPGSASSGSPTGC